MAEPLLLASGIETGYGKVQVLWGAALDVAERESVVLLGANGAGKTTLLKVLLGLLPAWGGTVRLGGEDITRMRTDHRVRRGMSYMSEIGVFTGLSIAENIRIGGQFVDDATLRRRTEELFTRLPRPGGTTRHARRRPVGRPAQDAGHRQGAGRRPAPSGDGRAFGRPVAAVRLRR